MKNNKTKHFKVAILGGGVTGSAIFYTLSKYTTVDSIALIEKCAKLGQINSRENNNSQTLHFGDIETNYSLDKAASTKEASEMVVNYLKMLGDTKEKIFTRSHKMALAVGKKEVLSLRNRYEEFKKIFPDLKLIERDEIAKLEPEIVHARNRKQELVAFYSDSSYVIDFGKLAESFADQAVKEPAKSTEIFLKTKVEKIFRKDQHYEIVTDNGTFFAEVVIVSMCAHSLLFAKSLGYGKEYSILPVGGNFYTSARKVLNGKVYTMQHGKLPFAAVHGDPGIHNENETRFGPTANVVPFLERNNASTFSEFIKSSMNNIPSLIAFLKAISDKLLLRYLLKNLVYEMPFFGPRAYVKLCRKIVPSLTHHDFKDGKSKAGIRPQLIDVRTGKLIMGEIEIIGDNILFNVTPSPGATACLKNAAKSVSKAMDFFGNKHVFNEQKMRTDLLS